MDQCSHCQTEFQSGEIISLEQQGYHGARQIGKFCSYACVSDFIEEQERENDVDLDSVS